MTLERCADQRPHAAHDYPLSDIEWIGPPVWHCPGRTARAPLSENHRRRRNGKTSARHRAWYRKVRKRISEGREYCRRCGRVTTELVLAHKIPHSHLGPYRRDNLVVLCKRCDKRQGNRPITDLPTLADEAA